jgi:hypothetical protein
MEGLGDLGKGVMRRSETVEEIDPATVTVPLDLKLIRLVHRSPQTEIWQNRQRHPGEPICWKGLRVCVVNTICRLWGV